MEDKCRMGMEVEMRAREETPQSRDLTPPIPPIAIALHDKFLSSRCSSCFRPLPNSPSVTTTSGANDGILSCSACSATVQYCSLDCVAADLNGHVSSGECYLFLLLRSFTAEDSANLRVALRLLYSFERLGILPSPTGRRESLGRIGGLLVRGLVEMMDEAGEMAESIREGAALLARARNHGKSEFRPEEVSVEAEMLWVVMLNAVEVEIGELGAVGVAVYGPWFSWFNHSCVPNACYRFELSSHRKGAQYEQLGPFNVFPACSGSQCSDVWKMWNFVDSCLAPGLCWFGPRIVIRSIKPLNKDDEVCITYMDLLQPKAVRQYDLWSRYHFICHCKRCCISPLMHIDSILNCDARSLNTGNYNYNDSETIEVADLLEEAITDYMLDGNSQNCCGKMEKILSDSFHCKQNLRIEKVLKPRLWLHPIHYLSLKAYIVLFSAYRIQAIDFDSSDLNEVEISNRFKMARAAAACSLLAAGATHHLFMSETSIISSNAVLWINAGESILYLASLISTPGQLVGSKIYRSLLYSKFVQGDLSMSHEDLLLMSSEFLKDISCFVMKLWPYLADGFSYLEVIENPVDFSWLRMAYNHQGYAHGTDNAKWIMKFCGSKYAEGKGIVEKSNLHQLAVHCLTYGGYLANICYGPGCYLSGKVRKFLGGFQ